MVKFPKEFEFICEDEIEFHNNGALAITHSLTLKAPNAQSQMTPLIKQDIMTVIMDSARNSNKVLDDEGQSKDKGKEGKEVVKIDGKLLIVLLYSSKLIKMDEFKNKFFKLLKEKNICLLDNAVSLTDQHIAYISDREFDRLMGEYFSNFFSF